MTCGLFVGLRDFISDYDHVDLPVGLRVDVRRGLDGDHERSVMVSVQLDLLVVTGALAPLLLL